MAGSEITDGPGNTILLIEAEGRRTSWTEPRDLSFDEAVDLLTHTPDSDDGHVIHNGFFYKKGRGRSVAFADGHSAFLARPLDTELAKALLTIAGGEPINPRDLETASEPQLDYGKCYGFGMFVFLTFLPAGWRRRRSGAARVNAKEDANAREREVSAAADANLVT